VVDGGTLIESNQQANIIASDRPSPDKGVVEHGAVIIYSNNAWQAISNVTIKNLAITNTLLQAYDQVRMVSYNNALQSRVSFESININGGSSYTFKLVNVPDSSVRKISWTYNGNPIANYYGWQ
jgi:hypothetical protein